MYSSHAFDVVGSRLAALTVAGDGQKLAVDANGRFDLESAIKYARALAPYRLRWYEEIGDPLDYDLNREVIQAYDGAVATGENLFSVQDATNLALFGGMRADLDIFQMDAFGVGDKDWNGAGHTSSDIPLALGKQVSVLLPWPLCLCRTG